MAIRGRNSAIERHVCVDKTLFIVSLVITSLLALVEVSCWLMAYRRRPKADGPLTPTPLYTICEPIPDYLSSIVEADAIYR